MSNMENSVLLRLINDATGPYLSEKEEALLKLKSLDKSQLWANLYRFSQSEDTDLVCRTLETMMIIDPSLGHSNLILNLKSNDAAVRWYICNLLTYYGNEESAPSLTQVVKNDPDADVRIYACIAIGNIGLLSSAKDLIWVIENDKGRGYEGKLVKDEAERALQKIYSKQDNILN